MEVSDYVVDFNAIRRAEHAYRIRLNAQPDDLDLRLRLAWCLFMQALYQSGQETVLKQLATWDASEESIEACDADLLLQDRDAQTILRECLHQTFTVIQLSPVEQDRQDGEKIQALVTLSGAQEILEQARCRSANVLAEMVRDVMRTAFRELGET